MATGWTKVLETVYGPLEHAAGEDTRTEGTSR